MNQSTISDTIGASKGAGGVQASIEASSQQAHEILRGGDIRIPGLTDGKNFSTSRDDSFDISCKSLLFANGRLTIVLCRE